MQKMRTKFEFDFSASSSDSRPRRARSSDKISDSSKGAVPRTPVRKTPAQVKAASEARKTKVRSENRYQTV